MTTELKLRKRWSGGNQYSTSSTTWLRKKFYYTLVPSYFRSKLTRKHWFKWGCIRGCCNQAWYLRKRMALKYGKWVDLDQQNQMKLLSNCILLSCQISISEWIYTLQLPGCQETPCSKQARYLKFKGQQRDSNPQPLSLQTNTQPFS